MFDKKMKNLGESIERELTYMSKRIANTERALCAVSEIGKTQHKMFCPYCGTKLTTIYPKCEKVIHSFCCTESFEYSGLYGYCEKCEKEVKICEKGEED